MLIGQLDVDAVEALARLRAHAYLNGRTASDVAWDIVERRHPQRTRRIKWLRSSGSELGALPPNGHCSGSPAIVGSWRAHPTVRWRIAAPREDAEQVQTVPPREPASPELDPRYYRSGVDARRRAHTTLADVPAMVDDVEDRIEQLLQRTLDLLGDKTTS